MEGEAGTSQTSSRRALLQLSITVTVGLTPANGDSGIGTSTLSGNEWAMEVKVKFPAEIAIPC